VNRDDATSATGRVEGTWGFLTTKGAKLPLGRQERRLRGFLVGS